MSRGRVRERDLERFRRTHIDKPLTEIANLALEGMRLTELARRAACPGGRARR